MSEFHFLKDGRVCLPSNADPAAVGTVVYGWLRHRVGLDLGRNDPSALVVIRDECYPEFSGVGFQQQLGKQKCTVVFHETVQLYSYTDLADYVANRLAQIPHWTLAVDASGLGAPFSSQLELAGIEHHACIMTAGAKLSQDGKDVTVAKTLLLENLATGLETGDLTIAHDLPDRQQLLNEIASFELASTSSGNLVLQGGGKGHHADRAIATALAYLSATHLEQEGVYGLRKLRGWA